MILNKDLITKPVIKYSKNLRLDMKERFVIIPVDRETRELIKEAKGQLTYNQFFTKLVSK